MKKNAQPEIKKDVVVFSQPVPAGEVIKKENVRLIKINASAYPLNAISDPIKCIGKRTTAFSQQGQFIFPDSYSDRGENRKDTSELFLVGIDVENISNFLGCQLKPGEKYLLYDKSTLIPTFVASVTIDGLIDAAGQNVSGTDNPTKTINVGVKTKAEMETIITKKTLKMLEITREPQNQ